MLSFIKKWFGTKSEKDVKRIRMRVEKIHGFEAQLHDLSDNALRERSAALKSKIALELKPIEDEKQVLKAQVHSDTNIESKETIFKSIEELEKKQLQMLAGIG